MKPILPAIFMVGVLSGCSILCPPPSAAELAQLPLVAYPDKPGAGDFIYKLPAGVPIDVHVLAEGGALAAAVDQTVSASLVHDLYLHKGWASEDGRHWVKTQDLIDTRFTLKLPTYQTPGPGEMRLTINRKAPE
ncbi:MAG: hypothetical protein ABSB19_11510 [Methylomonas sp.]|jgi:hypothetical protein